MAKLFIVNRKSEKISVLVEESPDSKGLAFVMHGLGGFKEQPHIQAMAEVFYENNYTVVRFDTTNTFGESDGNYENATMTNYYEDIEDVIWWAKSQTWYNEPFILAGHSLGGICVALYGEKFPHKVKALAPISTVVSGKLTIEAEEQIDPVGLKNWKTTGWRARPSTSRPGMVKNLKWSHMEDRLRYDLMPQVFNLTMPVLMIVGDKDDICPLKHQQILFDKLPAQKELHIIPGAPHTFTEPAYLDAVKKLFDKWIKKF